MGSLIGTAILVSIIVYFVFRAAKPDATKVTPKLAQPDRDWPAIVAKATEVAALHEKPCVALDILEGAVETAAHSSIGGAPSLPVDTPWPLDATGKPMIFLAQINFAEMPPLEGYPDKGLISFFVMDDDLQGCDFPSLDNNGFLIMYHDDPQVLVRRALPDHKFEYVPMSNELLHNGRPLAGRIDIGRISPNSSIAAALTKDWYRNCPDDLWDAFYDALTTAKSSVLYYGGHPDFTQDDFRRDGATPDYSSYSEVLFQMGFLYGRNTGIEVCWGDAGEACFLVTKEDLAAKRFEKAAYNWDCS